MFAGVTGSGILHSGVVCKAKAVKETQEKTAAKAQPQLVSYVILSIDN